MGTTLEMRIPFPMSLPLSVASVAVIVKVGPSSSNYIRRIEARSGRYMIKYSSVKPITRYLMEDQVQKKDYVHYNHTDPCKDSRWTSRESYQFMYARPWQKVLDFYSDVVNGHSSLSRLFGNECRDLSQEMHASCDDVEIVEAPDMPELMNVSTEDRTGRWARVTFKIVLSYHGGSFDGWQKQPSLNTVQGLVERYLGKFVDEKKAQQLREKGSPIEGIAVVAGRTDKGVTALKQVCSFYTWRKDVKPQHIVDALDEAAPGKLKVVSVAEVSRVFHPNFCAKWRRYLYIFPLNDGEDGEESCASEDGIENLISRQNNGGEAYQYAEHIAMGSPTDFLGNQDHEVESQKKSTRFKISKINRLLHQLDGKLLSYKMFARDLKPSRNTGPPTECFMYHVRAAETRLPCSAEDGKCIRAMCIELVANRFLRKMVRVLVATAIREAAAGAEEDALIKLMDATCRRATAPPAPPDGLCLVNVGYKEFDPRHCLIP